MGADPASGLHNHADVARYAHDLDALLAVSRAMSAERDVVRLLSLILDAAKELTGADRGSVFLVDEQRGELWTRVAQGAEPIRIPMGSGIVGAVIDSDDVINIADAYDHPRFNPEHDERSGYRTTSVLCVPLRNHEERVIGALQVLNKAAGGAFTAYDEHILMALGSNAAIALDTAQLIASDHERQRLSQEMALAREIQQSLLPRTMPVFAGWRLHAWQQPCDETGGDYHDFLLGDGHLDVVVGDVSGHGVAAALLVCTARASLRALHGEIADPAVLLSRLNTILDRDLAADAFMTMLLCRLRRDGSCCYVSAGHEPPLIYRHQDRAFDSLSSTGLVLGAMDGAAYETTEVSSLAAGDLLVSCTDGVFEANDPDHERQWGLDGLRAVIAAHAEHGGRAVLEAVVAEMRRHLGARPPEDDLTLVVAERLSMGLSLLPGPAPEPGELIDRWCFASRMDGKDPVIAAISQHLRDRAWVTAEDEHWLALVLEEVLVNAMFHGNEGDPSLEVVVELRLDGQRWVLTVRDHGSGFTVDNLPRLSEPDALLLEHGRGIVIMDSWVDELSYYEDGRVVLLAKRLADP